MLLCAVAFVVVASLGSCSPNKNNAATRRYQEFITRYNIYYNGDTHYSETLADMEGKYEDDYSRMLFMHPVEAKADESAPQPSGNFDRSIEKAQKAIQIRSIKKKPPRKSGKSKDPKYKEWMKRDEYNPFLHNAWMMMGRSQFYNGDFLGAASTFFYVSRHFSWLPQTVTEARLMQALSY
ncbi:MAG: tetratricopeptide repeat protein, partial [Muribaculaceae bacterium]|nr:tetratricopeptide repeat protein [Muribaculaceae bacterium]